ncbi:MAG: hypothetical protein WCJ72_05350 [Chryseobacterium sp.]
MQDLEFLAGLATTCFIGGFLLGIFLSAIIGSTSIKKNNKTTFKNSTK